MQCSNGHQNSGDKKFCTFCGLSLTTCPNGHVVNSSSNFCNVCGEKTFQPESPSDEIDLVSTTHVNNSSQIKPKKSKLFLILFLSVIIICMVAIFSSNLKQPSKNLQNTTTTATVRMTTTTITAQPEFVKWAALKAPIIQELKRLFNSGSLCTGSTLTEPGPVVNQMIADMNELENGAPMLMVKGQKYDVIKTLVNDTVETFKPGCMGGTVIANSYDVLNNELFYFINIFTTGGSLPLLDGKLSI
jgi:hypothetical protein